MTMARPKPLREGDAAACLVMMLTRSGCVRVPNVDRRQQENQLYKKGYEIRLRLRDDEELKQVRDCLKVFGLKPGKPYAHGGQVVQVAYGKEALNIFADLVKQAGVKSPKLSKLKRIS